MKAPNRDLLVLVKHARNNEEAMEKELAQLNKLLISVETQDTFATVYEAIDCNKFRVYNDPWKIMKLISSGEPAFVFLNNKN
ncbi:hypothetical protein ACFSQD_17875 [Flavihumibacter stibioxidans]|uniref:Uncharacterized protein n=1 Tax=Flavihumibacter stibioxidans TaxID=1834163 RepID=A0ABR7MCM9_9BACT|nr:hypothetical protein [Flavihumibacter stibioxidans]MBC6492707.1 hypothetical protein [Flavihumibacter stibioxidans]